MAATIFYRASNAGEGYTLSVDSGTVDGAENVKTPQLNPKARHDSDVVVYEFLENSLNNTVVVSAVGFWGVRNFEGSVVSVKRGIIEQPGKLLLTKGSATSEAHALFIFDDPAILTNNLLVTVARDKDNIISNPLPLDDRLHIGSIDIYQSITDNSLADSGWTVSPLVTGIREDSQGGQIFGSDGSVRRQLAVQQAVIDTEILASIPSKTDKVTIPTATISGDWIDQGGNLFTINQAQSGIITLPNVMTGVINDQKWMRFTAEVKVSNPAAGASSAWLKFGPSGIRPSNEFNLTQGFNQRVISRGTASNDLEVITSQLSSSANPTDYDIEIQILSIETFPPGTRADEPSEGTDRGPANLLNAIAASGPGSPVAVLLRSDDLRRKDGLLFYGIPDWGSYTDLDGDVTGGSFTLSESL